MGENDFPVAQIMDSVNWPKFDHPGHKKILKEGEDRDLSGNEG